MRQLVVLEGLRKNITALPFKVRAFFLKLIPFSIMAGRPTKYKAEYAEQVYKLCLLGHTDAEIALFFEVNEDTVNEWKKVHPEFSESIKRGKQFADGNVADSLYQRAMGYSHEDVDIKVIEGNIVMTPLIKHYPPDTAAAIFWLKNRQKAKWRDKQDLSIEGRVNLTLIEGEHDSRDKPIED